MSSNVKDVLKNFEDISKIPRCSYDEKRISDFLVDFGNKNGLKTVQDELNNVVITREASKGLEDKPGIILQGHMDMVCEKNDISTHDFTCDPIELIYEKNYIRANNTTLGADNGIALAMGMAILTDKNLEAPKIELVITTTEETGLEGANGFKEDVLTGKYFINLDSEEEGYLISGCAGGVNVLIDFDLEKEVKSGYYNKISVSNLKGGHSGTDINKELLNGVVVIGKLLKHASEYYKIKIVSIDGGTKHNAIPRNATVEFLTKREFDFDILKNLVKDFKKVEENIKVDFNSEYKSDIKCFSTNKSLNMINVINEIPNGVYSYMDGNYKDIVQSSSNTAIIKTKGHNISIMISVRSSKDLEKEKIVNSIKNIVENLDGSVSTTDGYSSWEFNESSKLRDIATKSYKEFTGNDMIVTVIHAGLECAVFQGKYPELDMISIGPDMEGVHTPEEKIYIDSTERVYEYLKFLINKLAKGDE